VNTLVNSALSTLPPYAALLDLVPEVLFDEEYSLWTYLPYSFALPDVMQHPLIVIKTTGHLHVPSKVTSYRILNSY